MFLFQLRAAEPKQSMKSNAEAAANLAFGAVITQPVWNANTKTMVMLSGDREEFAAIVKATATNMLIESARRQQTPAEQDAAMGPEKAKEAIRLAWSLELEKKFGSADRVVVEEAKHAIKPSAATVTLGEPVIGRREQPLTQSAQRALEIIERYEQQLRAEGNTRGLANLEANLKDQSEKPNVDAAKRTIASRYSLEQGMLRDDLQTWSKKAP